MEFKKLPVSKLTMNTGQIEGVPANPRQWTQADLDRLAASIEETPELLDARGAIVVPHKGKFVVLGGNMRLTAAKKLGLAEMPCAVLPADTPIETLKAVVIKDNSSMGAWDFDALANEWDDLPLTDWGVPAWKTEEDEEDIEEGLGEEYSQNIGEVVYEPKNTAHKIADLFQNTGAKFDTLIETISNQELKEMLRLRAAWFTDFNFAKIADYYAYQATPQEQRVFEALGLVLLDKDQLIANGFAELQNDFKDETNHE